VVKLHHAAFAMPPHAIRETIKSAVNQGWGEANGSAMIKALELQGDVRVGHTLSNQH
jgi:hypothetical protein